MKTVRVTFLLLLLVASTLAVAPSKRETEPSRLLREDAIVFSWAEDLWSFQADTGQLGRLTTTLATQERMPAISPDRRRVAFVSYGEGYLASEIVVKDLLTGRERRITRNRDADLSPAWSSDGRRLAWSQDQGVGAELVIGDELGSIERRLPLRELGILEALTPRWSPAENLLAFAATADDRDGLDIYVYNLEGGRLRRLGPGEMPVWSPDGRQLAALRRPLDEPPRIVWLDAATGIELASEDRPAVSVENLWWTRNGLLWWEVDSPATDAPEERFEDRSPRIVHRDAGVLLTIPLSEAAAGTRASAITTEPRCWVSALVLEDSYSRWTRFHANLAGDCGFDPGLGTRTSVQYFADGMELGHRMGVNPTDWECRNTAGLGTTVGPTVNWVFPTSGGHTLGARVVEWRNVPREGRQCDDFSSIVSRSVGLSVPGSDSDADSLANGVESFLIGRYRPTFQLDPTEPGPQANLESVTVRAGPAFVRSPSTISLQILMNYNVLWWTETGDCVTAHSYDTEPMAYRVQGGSRPYSTAGWSVAQTKTIAHDGTACEDLMTLSGYVNPVYVGQGKHGNFLRVSCNDWFCCDQCSASGPALAYTPHNVGNGRTQPGNCGHNNHLRNGSFLVPSKWGRMAAAFGLFSPFPPE